MQRNVNVSTRFVEIELWSAHFLKWLRASTDRSIDRLDAIARLPERLLIARSIARSIGRSLDRPLVLPTDRSIPRSLERSIARSLECSLAITVYWHISYAKYNWFLWGARKISPWRYKKAFRKMVEKKTDAPHSVALSVMCMSTARMGLHSICTVIKLSWRDPNQRENCRVYLSLFFGFA